MSQHTAASPKFSPNANQTTRKRKVFQLLLQMSREMQSEVFESLHVSNKAVEAFCQLPGDLQGEVMRWIVELPEGPKQTKLLKPPSKKCKKDPLEGSDDPFALLSPVLLAHTAQNRELWSRLASRHFGVSLSSWMLLEKLRRHPTPYRHYRWIWQQQRRLTQHGWSLLDVNRVAGHQLPSRFLGGTTALMWVADSGDLTLMRLLLAQRNVDVNIQDVEGKTALMFAYCRGFEESMKLLLAQPGINVNLQDQAGNTALIDAAHKGALPMVQLLLQQPGVDLNVQEYPNAYTALMMAVRFRHFDVFKALLDHGAKLDLESRDDGDVFDIANQRGSEDMRKLLIQKQQEK